MKSITLSTIASSLLLLVAVSNPSIAQEGANTLYHYDSGWQSDDAFTSHETVFQHSLGIPPTNLTLWFTPALVEGEAEEVHPVIWTWSPGYTGNPVSIIVNNDEIKLTIYARLGVKEAWVVDPDAEHIIVHDLATGEKRLCDKTATSNVLAGFELAVAPYFAALRG